MPKLIITLIEKHIEVPGEPERFLAGFETIFDLTYEDGESEQDAILPSLVPLIDSALKHTMNFAVGIPMMSGEGSLESTREAAIAKATENPFPVEI